jgi:hypothetical protein
MKHNPLILLSLVLLTSVAQAESYPPVEENNWEVSFGTTQMFIGWYEKGSSPVPTASATIIFSRKIFKDFALWSVLNLPLAPNKRVTEEGLLVETQTPPTLMLGASYEVFKYEISETKSLGIDAGISVGRSLTLEGKMFPVGAFRFKFLTSQDNTMYVGATTSPYNAEGDVVWGVIYGAGTRF